MMNVSVREAARELLRQIDIGTFVDSHGHDAKMLKAVSDLRAALADDVVVGKELDAIVDEYSDEYEWDDGDTHHVPNDQERILLTDFGHGLVSILHEHGLLKSSLSTMRATTANKPSPNLTDQQLEALVGTITPSGCEILCKPTWSTKHGCWTALVNVNGMLAIAALKVNIDFYEATK